MDSVFCRIPAEVLRDLGGDRGALLLGQPQRFCVGAEPGGERHLGRPPAAVRSSAGGDHRVRRVADDGQWRSQEIRTLKGECRLRSLDEIRHSGLVLAEV